MYLIYGDILQSTSFAFGNHIVVFGISDSKQKTVEIFKKAKESYNINPRISIIKTNKYVNVTVGAYEE